MNSVGRMSSQSPVVWWYREVAGMCVEAVPVLGAGSEDFMARPINIGLDIERFVKGIYGEQLHEGKSSGSGLENRDYSRRGSAALTTRHPSIRRSWHKLRRQTVVCRPIELRPRSLVLKRAFFETCGIGKNSSR
jgi:hypothetical protein